MKPLTHVLKHVAIILIVAGPLAKMAQAQDRPTLSDVEVAHVAVTANQIDIDYAKIAQKRSKNKDILNFAETMATDHAGVIKQAAALAEKLGVTPKDNAVSQSLLDGAKTTRAELNKKSKKDFDKAYVDNEVAYHKAVIAAVRDVLIPETENKELKALLETVLPVLETHLHHAEMVQKKF